MPEPDPQDMPWTGARGPYEAGEPREPLQTRVVGGWTRFEALLFNLVTQEGDRPKRGLFSTRLEATQRMLEAYDATMRGD